MHSKPVYECTGFGVVDATKPYKLAWLGDMDGPKPYMANFKDIAMSVGTQHPVRKIRRNDAPCWGLGGSRIAERGFPALKHKR